MCKLEERIEVSQLTHDMFSEKFEILKMNIKKLKTEYHLQLFQRKLHM